MTAARVGRRLIGRGLTRGSMDQSESDAAIAQGAVHTVVLVCGRTYSPMPRVRSNLVENP